MAINNKSVNKSFIQTKKIDDFLFDEYEEELPNGRKYRIYKFIHYIPYAETPISDNMTTIIPADSYFLMGDNRDNAEDSRYLGVIKRQQIIGKAVFILSGKSLERMNVNLLANS